MVELKHLRLLQKITELGTMSAAARDLGYSQPAVTQQLQNLERSIGTPVLVRSRGTLIPTEAGRVLLRHGEHILDRMAQARTEIDALTGLGAGMVRIVAFPSAAAAIVPATMATMRTQHPKLAFSLVEGTPVQALAALTAGECDIAIVFRYSSEPELSDSALSWHPLLHERVHLALPPGFPVDDADDEPTMELAALRDASWIAGCPRCRGHLYGSCAAVGYEPNVVYETDDYVAQQSLTVSGLGVSLIPDLILSVVSLPGLRLVRPVPDQFREIHAVTLPGLLAVPSVAATLHAMRATAAAIDLGR